MYDVIYYEMYYVTNVKSDPSKSAESIVSHDPAAANGPSDEYAFNLGAPSEHVIWPLSIE
jgi:hypothetical protein